MSILQIAQVEDSTWETMENQLYSIIHTRKEASHYTSNRGKEHHDREPVSFIL
jgi:hypothetical protein